MVSLLVINWRPFVGLGVQASAEWKVILSRRVDGGGSASDLRERQRGVIGWLCCFAPLNDSMIQRFNDSMTIAMPWPTPMHMVQSA